PTLLLAPDAECECCPAERDPAWREKHPFSLSLDAEHKRQLLSRSGGIARPKAQRAQDDRRLHLRNSGLIGWDQTVAADFGIQVEEALNLPDFFGTDRIDVPALTED